MRSHKPNVVHIRRHLGKQLKMIKKKIEIPIHPKENVTRLYKEAVEESEGGMI